MLELNNLESLCKDRKRRGRGGSRGGTSGRGHKGQLARSGGKKSIPAFFEGGQMPLTRRLPRRGFTNRFRTEYSCIALSELERRFEAGTVVDMAALREVGLIKKARNVLVKVLANGTLSKALTINVHACTKGAQAHIEKAGGSVQLVKEMSSDSSAT